MVVERRYATNVSQSTDYMNYTSPWQGLNLAITNDNRFATCELSKYGENNSKPAILYFTDFQFSIPSYANVTHIRLGYKDKYVGDLILSSPLIRVLNGYGSAYGENISTTGTEHIISRDNNQLTVEQVNSDSFGVSIEYPENTSKNTVSGTAEIGIDYVWIEIEYDVPSYFLQLETSDSKISVGESFLVTLSCKNTSDDNYGEYLTTVQLNIPDELNFVRKVSGAGTISDAVGGKSWNTLISKTTSTVTLEFEATEDIGYVLLQAEELSTGQIATKTITVSEMQIDFTCDIPKYVLVDEVEDEIEFKVKATSTARTGTLLYAMLNLPGSLEYVSQSGTAFYDENTGELTLDFGNSGSVECTIKCKVCYDASESIDLFYENDEYYFEFSSFIGLSMPYYSYVELDADTLELMQNGETYTVASYMKIIQRDSSQNMGYFPYSNVMAVTQEDNFLEGTAHVTDLICSTQIETFDTYIRKEVSFEYDDTKPVYVLFLGEYNMYDLSDVLFTEPQVIETQYFQGLEERGLFPKPIHNILEEVNSAHVVIPAKTSTGRIRLSNINWGGFTSQKDIVIHEIKTIFNIANNIPVLASASLVVPSQTVNRSEIIPANDGSEEYTIGKDYDIWNMKHENLDEYKDLEIELQLRNTSSNPVTIDLRNFYLQFRFLELEKSNAVGFSVDGDHSRYYGVFMDDRDLGLGFNSTVKEHREDASDFAIEYLQNLKNKTITIEANLRACTQDEAVIMADKLVQLVTTKRRRNNKPILKKLRFDDFPGRYWLYYLDDEIDWDPSNNQKIKFKVTVPDGVAYRDNEIIGSGAGYIESITKVNPIILLIADVDGSFTITDTVTGQKITVRDNTIFAGDLIRIDCRNRVVERIANDNNIDITNSTDINSDFFSLIEDYELDTNNTCTIQSVTYREAV